MLTLFLSSLLTGCGGEAPKQNTFDNLPPFSPIISMTPADPYTTDDLVVGIITESTDPDGDSVTTSYVWTVDGVVSDQSSETVPASATAKGEVWTVNVISNDGSLDSAPATFSVTIKNTAPAIDSYTATEDAVFGDALSVTVDSTSDADNDTVELDFTWTVNGEGSAYDTGEIPEGITQVNEVWVLTITPNDGDTNGEAVVVTYDFTNAVPVVNSAVIEPDPASSADELSVVIDATDAEDDAIESYTYEWFINGESAGTEATLAAGTAVRDDVVSVSVTASDMYGTSAAVSSADITIGNAAPSIDAWSITPDPATTSDALMVTATASDADGDSVDVTYEWFVNGATAGTTDTLDSSAFVKGDSVTVTATATDGTDTVSSTSSAIVIANTAPEASIAIVQSSAVTTDDLSATYSSSDVDGDTLTTSIDWLVDGVSLNISTDTLDSSNFTKGQSVTVQITVDDGTDSITETSAAVVIDNSDPSADSTIGPMAAVYGENVTCGITNESDADGDTVSIESILWTFGSGATETTTGTDLALTVADHGSETSVACTPTFTDGEASVAGSASDDVSITDYALRHLQVGDLVITEIMSNPSAVQDADSEWFEVWINSALPVLNRGDVNLYGLTIEDLDSDSDTLNMDMIVDIDSYIVFGENDDTSVNGDAPVDYVYSGISLSNTADELVLIGDTIVIDQVIWTDSTFPSSNGEAMNLSPSAQDATSNDNGAFWCNASNPFGDGDLGTPGTANSGCP